MVQKMALNFIRPLSAGLLLSTHLTLAAVPHHGRQFIGLSDFSRFTKGKSNAPGGSAFVSPVFVPEIKWNELVVSWNAALPEGALLKIEARAIYPERSTRFYTMGIWSGAADDHLRMSVKDQKDDDAEVLTDTLALKTPCDRAQIRLILSGTANSSQPPAKFLGLSFADTKHELPVLPPNRAAWGKSIPVPERSQLDYPEGEQSWCSPASTSMILAWWAAQLKRPELDRAVPDVANQVLDPNWPGTGNWPFNTAYAGSLPGIRAYISRFSDVSELEDWIAGGIPVAVSVANTVLQGVPPREGPDGHLVVCVGFTKDGDVIVNDPGTRRQIRRAFPRENLVRAWARSHNTVYLIYPEGAEIPEDRFAHWDFKALKSSKPGKMVVPKLPQR
ncbi:MAG: hypothetical protein DME19_20570 [Verrucomicrobia bacterium]|nr:MAG: hypothetical protein DME19_20570 [Verrucomicrobiota bacterium]